MGRVLGEMCGYSLCEVEACVSSRPLTYASDSVDSETVNPLTPSHFLIGRSFVSDIGDLRNEVVSVATDEIRAREVQYKLRLQAFWLVWSKMYLRNLPPALSKFAAKGNLKVGSIVLIREDNVKRLNWPLARVLELHPGRDGIARSATLKTATSVVTRPVQRLHDLELVDDGANLSGLIPASDPQSADDSMNITADGQTSGNSVNVTAEGQDSGDISDGVDSDVSGSSARNEEIVTRVSSKGRVIKQPQRLVYHR